MKWSIPQDPTESLRARCATLKDIPIQLTKTKNQKPKTKTKNAILCSFLHLNNVHVYSKTRNTMRRQLTSSSSSSACPLVSSPARQLVSSSLLSSSALQLVSSSARQLISSSTCQLVNSAIIEHVEGQHDGHHGVHVSGNEAASRGALSNFPARPLTDLTSEVDGLKPLTKATQLLSAGLSVNSSVSSSASLQNTTRVKVLTSTEKTTTGIAKKRKETDKKDDENPNENPNEQNKGSKRRNA